MRSGFTLFLLVLAVALVLATRTTYPESRRAGDSLWLEVEGIDDFAPGLTEEEAEYLREQGVPAAALSIETRGETHFRIRPFLIARREVSNGEYAIFLAGPAGAAILAEPTDFADRRPRPGTEDLPVRGIGRAEAMAYAASVGARLPTELEWEWAFRRRRRQNFLFGNRFAPDRVVSSMDGPRPVGAARWAIDGLFHVSGNVAEWTASGTAAWALLPPNVDLSSSGLESGRVTVRGGSFRDRGIDCRLTARRPVSPADRPDDVGLRLARDR